MCVGIGNAQLSESLCVRVKAREDFASISRY
jgi:hypothetical protein